MSSGSEIVADALFDSLITGESFDVPTVDLNDPIFSPPDVGTSALYQEIKALTNEDLTTRTVGGTGAYDAIMEAQAEHLKDEYEHGRITGAEYTKAYIALGQAAISQGVQFLLGRDQAYWAAINAQMQALTARVQLETAKAQLALAQIEAKNQRAVFALNKIRLANEDAQYGINKYNLDNILPAQKSMLLSQFDGQEIANDSASYVLANKLPKDVALLTSQIALSDEQKLMLVAQKAMVILQQTGQTISNDTGAYQLANLLPAQKDQLLQQTTNLISEELGIDARTAQTTQQTTNLVAEALNIPKQGTVLTNQAAQIAQQTTNLASENLSIVSRTALTEQQKTNLISENLGTVAKTTQITQQTANLIAEALNIPKQGSLIDAQTAGQTANTSIATYNLSTKLPAEVAVITAQGNLVEEQVFGQQHSNTAATYSNTFILPNQKDLVIEQLNTARAQTTDTRADTSAVTGAIGTQKDLYAQQITSYQLSAQLNAAKIYVDAWTALKAIDENTDVLSSFDKANIEEVLGVIQTTNSLGTP